MTSDMEQIAAFLRTMKFKGRLVGGCDKEDVLNKFETLTQLYKTYIEGLQSEVEQAKASAKVFQEKWQGEQIRGDALQGQLAAAPAGKAEYESNSQLLQSALLRQEKDRAAIIAQAEREAKRIVFQAEERVQTLINQRRQEAKTQIAELENKAEQMRRELKKLEQERGAGVLEMRTSLRLIRQDLTNMVENLDGLAEKIDQPQREGKAGDHVGYRVG